MKSSDDMPITAIVPWLGGKRGMADDIARECCRADGRPPKSFWELCCGSMAVSLAMPRCSQHHVVDMHGDLINLARVIQDTAHGASFYRRLRRVLNHEGLFNDSKESIKAAEVSDDLFATPSEATEDPVLRAIRYFLVSWQGRNGTAGTRRINYQPAVRWTAGGGHGAVRFANAVRSIPAWRRRMRDISILDRDIFDVLPKIEDADGTSIYIDPPYIRDGTNRSGSCQYLYEFKVEDHKRLFESVKRFKSARVVVSYYDHPELRSMYQGWTFVSHATQKNLHVQNRRGVGKCEAPEVLIINGPSYATGGESHG